MKILVVYGTNSGGTLLAAEQFAGLATEKGHQANLARADTVEPKKLTSYDLVVLGSCTWEDAEGPKRLEGQLQYHMAQFAKRLEGLSFPRTAFAVFGLGDHLYENRAAAADLLEALVHRVGGHLIGQPLKILGYYVDRSKNEKQVRTWAASILLKLK
jgi:flavodoxin